MEHLLQLEASGVHTYLGMYQQLLCRTPSVAQGEMVKLGSQPFELLVDRGHLCLHLYDPLLW